MDPIGTLMREGSDFDAGKGDQPLENESLIPNFRTKSLNHTEPSVMTG